MNELPVEPVSSLPKDASRKSTARRLSDGQWHRLHPATPLLRGGIAFIAALGIIISNLRERLLTMFVGGPNDGGDPVTAIVDGGFAGVALAIFALVLLLFVGGFYLSWRMHTFRITDEVVEVRSGILFRTNRKGRLDRIQGINIQRPLFARLFGAAKLEVNVAGHDANVQLSYLSSANADQLRRDILRLASGTRDAAPAELDDPESRNFIDQRVAELLAPELDPNLAPPESVVAMHTGRLIGSILLNDTTFVLAAISISAIVAVVSTGRLIVLVGLASLILAVGSFVTRRLTKSLRYTIAGTADGVRIGYGLLTTSNETLPPGRIHSVQVSQPILWRGFGWWEVKVNTASKSSNRGADGQANTTILPVGNLGDVLKVLALVLPGMQDDASKELLRTGVLSKGGADGFTNSPRRSIVLRWFSWRRNGFADGNGVVLFRKGAIWRKLVIVPQPRVQSIGLHQGPLERALGLAVVRLHTVAGPISAQLGAVDRDAALAFFERVSLSVVEFAHTDTSHRWRSGEAPA